MQTRESLQADLDRSRRQKLIDGDTLGAEYVRLAKRNLL